ncbi:MAG: hypothetical protein D6732_11515 [Methanobacteriota archaeon]|nr:MAG: hypothetical protein D6732_11515 [Euryarchaeota archaeon]
MSSADNVSEFISFEIAQVMDLIKKGNQLLQKQAEERYNFLRDMLSQCDLSTDQGVDVLKMLIGELFSLQADFQGLNVQKEIIDVFSETMADEEMKNLLEENPHILELINQGLSIKEALAQEILRHEANIMAREELIDILREDIEYMESENMRLAGDIHMMEETIRDMASRVTLLEKLFLHSPKFKAVEIISKHPEGLSYTQLSYLLNVPINEAISIAIELEQNFFVSRSGNMIRPLVGQFAQQMKPSI